jgi:BASS family bile acid:Na+ symporter
MTTQQLFNAIFNVSLTLMVVTLVAGLGLGMSVSQIVAPMRRVWLLLGTVLVNTILAPLIAIGVCELFPISDQTRDGVVIVTIAAAGPAGMKAAELAKRADMAMALSFTIVLQLLNIVAAPLWARAIISGATVNVWSIVGDLLLLVLLPLVVGLVLHARYTEHAPSWKAGLEKTSNISLVVALGVGIGVNWQLLVSSIGSWVLVASAVISLIYAAAGWLVAIRDTRAAITISMVSAFRFTPIGLIVISTVLNNQGVYLTPALIFALVDTIVPFALGAEIGRFVSRQPVQLPSTPDATVHAQPRAAGHHG